MFSSFNHISLRKILEISGNAVEVGALVLEDSIGGFPGYYCQQAGFACYHPPIELLTDENVRDCKEHGVKMNVWTVNDMAGLEQLHRWGCEGIITNYPGALPVPAGRTGHLRESARGGMKKSLRQPHSRRDSRLRDQIFMQTSHARQMTVRRLPMATQSPTRCT